MKAEMLRQMAVFQQVVFDVLFQGFHFFRPLKQSGVDFADTDKHQIGKLAIKQAWNSDQSCEPKSIKTVYQQYGRGSFGITLRSPLFGCGINFRQNVSLELLHRLADSTIM